MKGSIELTAYFEEATRNIQKRRSGELRVALSKASQKGEKMKRLNGSALVT